MSQTISDSKSASSKAVGAGYTGFLLIVLASLLWSLNGALIKIVSEGGRGPGGVSIAFYRSLVAGLFLLPIALYRIRARPQARAVLTRPAALWCVVFFTLMTLCFVVANTMTQAASVIILQYTSTFWIFGLSPLILKEKPQPSDLWILGLAMVGIAVIFLGPSMWPYLGAGTVAGGAVTASSFPSSSTVFGLVIALASGFFYSLLTLMIRRLRDADSATVTVMNNLGSAILLFPLLVAVSGLSLSPRSFWLLVFMGVVQFGIPYYLYTLGLARIPAYHAALITLLEPVLVPIWAYLAIGPSELPTAWTLIGGGIIILALLMFLNSARRARFREGVVLVEEKPVPQRSGSSVNSLTH